MKDSTKIGLVLLGFAAVVSFAFARTDPPAPSFAASAYVASGGAGGAVSETPGKDNVSHTYRAEVARLEQRLEAAPDDTTARVELARLKQGAHRLDEAVGHYARYLALHPANRQAWLDLAAGYGGLERWAEAEQAMHALLERWPADPAALYNLGAICANQGKTDEARAWWEKARDQQADTALADQAASALIRLAHRP